MNWDSTQETDAYLAAIVKFLCFVSEKFPTLAEVFTNKTTWLKDGPRAAITRVHIRYITAKMDRYVLSPAVRELRTGLTPFEVKHSWSNNACVVEFKIPLLNSFAEAYIPTETILEVDHLIHRMVTIWPPDERQP